MNVKEEFHGEIENLLNDVYRLVEEQSDKLNEKQSSEMLTNEYLREILDHRLKDESMAYNAGERLSFEDWKNSAVAAPTREETDQKISDARRDYYDSRARALRSKNGKSGYGAYAAAERKNAYERMLKEATAALAESYGEFYDELESDSSWSNLDERMSVIDYIASNRMTEREGLLYALGAGLSYEEASEIAYSAYMLGELLKDRFEDYGYDIYGQEIKN